MSMEGQADDFLIDEKGDIVMLDDDEPEIKIIEEGSVIAVVLQGSDGEMVVQVFGPPSKALVAALQNAMRAMLCAIAQDL